jgi:hypothetical protein
MLYPPELQAHPIGDIIVARLREARQPVLAGARGATGIVIQFIGTPIV